MTTQRVYFPEPGRAELREERIPDPGPGEIQVRTLANGICMYEVSLFRGIEPISPTNKIGHEGIGVVTKVGKGVSQYQEGDYVACSNWVTLQNHDCNVAKLTQAPKDTGTFLIEPVACIVNALYTYDITPGDRVLLLGAGFMGLLNVQGLAHYPLSQLVVADINPRNLELAKSYGATEVINSATPEGSARIEELQATPFDLVVECAGVEATLQQAGALARRGGRLAIFAWHHGNRSVDFGLWHTRGIRVLNASPMSGQDRRIDTMQRAVWLLERGVFDLTNMVTHRHPITSVQEAMEIASSRPAGYIKGVLEFPIEGTA